MLVAQLRPSRSGSEDLDPFPLEHFVHHRRYPRSKPTTASPSHLTDAPVDTLASASKEANRWGSTPWPTSLALSHSFAPNAAQRLEVHCYCLSRPQWIQVLLDINNPTHVCCRHIVSLPSPSGGPHHVAMGEYVDQGGLIRVHGSLIAGTSTGV